MHKLLIITKLEMFSLRGIGCYLVVSVTLYYVFTKYFFSEIFFFFYKELFLIIQRLQKLNSIHLFIIHMSFYNNQCM